LIEESAQKLLTRAIYSSPNQLESITAFNLRLRHFDYWATSHPLKAGLLLSMYYHPSL